ncbi:4096_t:CDS:2, partial [Diversispora eburnea]
MSSEEEEEFIFFDPPLWRQRRSLAVEVLRKNKVTSVFDYGCGEGSLLSFLIQPYEEEPILHLAGVDISHEALKSVVLYCQPMEDDYAPDFLRLSPLTIELYQGSIDVADERLIGIEAIVCLEVIEHVYPNVLNKFFETVLGTYKPKVLIVSTPNVEFNVYFPQLKYGTPEAIPRIDDHKFEWTRKEFQEWCNVGAKKYNYSVEFTGVGKLKYSDPTVGFATQIAIFQDLQPD